MIKVGKINSKFVEFSVVKNYKITTSLLLTLKEIVKLGGVAEISWNKQQNSKITLDKISELERIGLLSWSNAVSWRISPLGTELLSNLNKRKKINVSKVSGSRRTLGNRKKHLRK